MRWTWFAAMFAGVVAWAGPAAADVDRVVLADGSPVLRGALTAVLEPWSVELVVVTDGTPGATMPAASARAREIATAHQAGATVWVAGEAGEYAVWVYDVASDQIVARKVITAPPFDEATAAAVALSVKSLLRHSQVAAPAERFGAVEGAARGDGPAALEFYAGGGVRIRRTQAGDFEPRLAIGARWFPALADRRYGLSLQIASGPGINLDEPELVGHFSDVAASLGVHARFELAPWLVVAPSLGGSLHFTHLEGIVTASDRNVSVNRVNPFVEAGVRITVPLGDAVRLAARVEGAASLRRQNYLVQGQTVLELPVGELEADLLLEMPLQ
jgi:hypothetical protein